MIPKHFPSWESIDAYYRIWSIPKEDGSPSLLEQALKKSGWRGARKAESETPDALFDHRFSECEEHRHGGEKGL